MAGVLEGLRIIELAGIGPAPFCGMMLADHGAEVIRIDRKGGGFQVPHTVLFRGRRSITVDLKEPEGVELVRRLCASADGLIEGFRPGVMERLGLGPEELLGRNDRLVYGRITGWGQEGPLAQRAGHDINYLSIAGALHTVGRHGERPVPPVNYVADFGGGGMLLAFGMVSALLAVARGGKGQVVDAAMVDGTALMLAMNWGLMAADMWRDERGCNLIDGGSHFYDTYETADGKFVAIGPVEPQFYAELLEKLDLADDPDLARQMDPDTWEAGRRKLEIAFKTKPRAYWEEQFSDTDACLSPVLSMTEAAEHPHNVARGTYVEIDGQVQPDAAPRFSQTPAGNLDNPPRRPDDEDAIVLETGYSQAEIDAMRKSGIIA
ncbi:MAG: CoA transferase [Sphingomonadaceae bacterium]|nr:CoA transferase [Sphingomonadaceae bacterium]